MKIVCTSLCAVLLFMCFGARFLAGKFTKKSEPDERLVIKIKLITLIASIALFIYTLIFVK